MMFWDSVLQEIKASTCQPELLLQEINSLMGLRSRMLHRGWKVSCGLPIFPRSCVHQWYYQGRPGTIRSEYRETRTKMVFPLVLWVMGKPQVPEVSWNNKQTSDVVTSSALIFYDKDFLGIRTASETWDLFDKVWMNLLDKRTCQTGDEDHKPFISTDSDKSFQLSKER